MKYVQCWEMARSTAQGSCSRAALYMHVLLLYSTRPVPLPPDQSKDQVCRSVFGHDHRQPVDPTKGIQLHSEYLDHIAPIRWTIFTAR